MGHGSALVIGHDSQHVGAIGENAAGALFGEQKDHGRAGDWLMVFVLDLNDVLPRSPLADIVDGAVPLNNDEVCICVGPGPGRRWSSENRQTGQTSGKHAYGGRPPSDRSGLFVQSCYLIELLGVCNRWRAMDPSSRRGFHREANWLSLLAGCCLAASAGPSEQRQTAAGSCLLRGRHPDPLLASRQAHPGRRPPATRVLRRSKKRPAAAAPHLQSQRNPFPS
jgi:hypothetical protein